MTDLFAEYDALIKRSRQLADPQLKGSLYSSVDTNPDEEAGLHQLAQKVGLPVEALRNDRGAEARRQAAARSVENLPSEAPVTAGFLSAPEHAALAHDDLENLSALEQLLAEPSWFDATVKAGVSAGSGIFSGVATFFRGMKASYRQGEREIAARLHPNADPNAPKGTPAYRWLDKHLTKPWDRMADHALANIETYHGQIARDLAPRYAGTFMENPSWKRGVSALISGGVSLGVAIPVSMLAGPEAGAAILSTAESGPIYEDALRAGKSPKEAFEFAVKAGLATYALEKFGLDQVLKATGGRVSRFLRGLVAESGTEGAQNTVQNAIARHGFDASVGYFDDLIESLIGGMVGGPAAVLFHNNQAARAAQRNQQFMEALGDTAKASKLRERLPEKFQELVARIKEKGSVENVFIPAEQWRTFWQERGADPEQIAGQIGATDFQEALATGGDLTIPLEAYAAKLAGSEHHAELLRDVRLHQGEMTPREAEEFQANREERFAGLLGEAETLETDSSRQVYEDVFGQLLGVGRERGTAEREALLWQERYRARAERLGVDPFELYQEQPLRIGRPLPEVLTRRDAIDTSIDPYLDALREGLPEVDQGTSLLEFLRGKGVSDDRGDLASMDIDRDRKPFTRKLLREDGISLDKAGELAWEAGFFLERPTTAELLQAIDAELRGSPVYAQGEVNEQAQARRADLEQLREFLDSMGIDLSAMDNEQVRKILEQGQVLEPPAEYGILSAGAVNEAQIELDFDALPPEGNASGRGNAPRDGDVQPTGRVSFYRPKGSSLPRNISAELSAQVDQVQTGTFQIGLERIASAADAAHVLASLRKKAKENFAVLVTGENHQPLAILDVSTGSSGASIVDPKVFAGAILDVPGAQHVWFGHNHPTGMTTPSQEDKAITSRMADLLHGSGVEISGHVIVGSNGDYTSLAPTGYVVDSGRATAAARRGAVPVMDSRIVARSKETAISSPEAAADYLADKGDGVLLVNNKNVPVAWVAMNPEEMGKLRQGDSSRGSALLLRAASQSGAAAMIVRVEKSADSAAAENVARFGNAASIRPLDLLAGEEAASNKRGMPTGATFYQSASNQGSAPVTTLTGKELGEALTAENVVERARSFFKKRLQGKTVSRDGFGDVRVTGKGWHKLKRGLPADILKAQLIPAIPEIIKRGEYHGRTELAKERKDAIIAFHFFTAAVEIDGQTVEAGVSVAEDSFGNLFYNLNQLLEDERPRFYPGKAQGAEPSSGSDDATFNQSIPENGDNVNISIVKQTFGETGKRGSITFGPEARSIEFFEKADLSTFLHESSHAWLEELKADAARETAPEQVIQDWQTIAAWLGIEADAAEIPVEAHEQFARGGEAYLMEGKAPSVELQAAFQRFKAWLLHIYRSLKGLDVKLNAEVRGVFDRLLATDEQIAAAEQLQQFTPLFADAATAGMTEAEFAAYRQTAAQAHEEAAQRLQQQLMDELSREQQKWWQEERAKIRAEVEAEAKKNPVYQAVQALTKGEDFDGNQAPEGFKLSKTDLVKMYGKAFLKRLPRAFQRVYAKEGGLHPDAVAEIFGFASGDEMIQQMVNTPPMKQVVAAETEVRMRELYGDLLHDGSLAEEAIKAVHSDRQGQVLRAELRALKRQQRAVRPFIRAEKEAERQARLEMESTIPPLEAFKLWATQTIGHKALREVRPDLYLKAGQKAGRLAFEAAGKGDFATAGLEKQRQLLNHYLFLEATAARKEAEQLIDYARRLQKPAAQQRIGKAGGDYLEQINALLEKYEFKPQSLETLQKRRSLLEWVQQQEEMGLEPAIDEQLLIDAGKRNFKTLTIDELRAVRDALKNIEHLSKQANHLRIEGEEIELAEALRELSASAAEHFDVKRLPIDRETRSWLKQQGELFARLDASLIKAEQLIEWLDGGRIDGPWARLIFRPIAAAETAEHDLTLQYTAKLAELFQAYGAETGGRLLEKIHITSLGESLTRQALIAAALNTGNTSNYTKLLEGYGWRPDQLQEILSHLDGADWRFVQSVWDTIETLWPQIEALEKRLSGVAPPKVQPRQITNRHGTFAGGYYPVVYDPLHSAAGEKQTDARGDKLFDAAYVRATTEKGHTKARIEQAAYPMLLNLAVIPQHLAQVIHDLTHRETVVAANRLLNNAGLRGTLNATAGPVYHRMLKQWLANVANDRNIDRTGNEFWTRFFSGLRTNATIVGMGLRFTTMFSQLAGLSQSLDIVKGRYLAKALPRYVRHPFQAAAWVREKSGEMRHRSNSLDRDIRDGIRKLMGKKGPRVWLQAKAFAGIALFDALVSTPTWMAAYEQAKVEGHLSEKDAVAQADRAVRLSQGSGGAKDLAAVQRSNDLMKLFTMFYSYFSVLYNRLRNMGRLKGIGEIGFMDVAWKSFVMVMLPAVAAEMLSGRGPDDDEEPAEWALRKIALYPLMSVPLLRDMANSWDSGYGYQLTPLSRALETATKLPDQIAATAAGEKDVDDLIFQAFDLPGYLFGLPTGQAKNTTRYLWDVWDGDIHPEDGGDILQGLLFGERRK